MRVEGEHFWIPVGRSAVSVWVHGPQDKRVRSGLMIAPPMSREHLSSYRTLRYTALRAAEHGHLVFRLAYRGVGDGGPLETSSDPVQEWTADLRAVASHLRRALGAGTDLPMSALGLRLGASLLHAAELEFDRVVLWEPVDGRTFVDAWSKHRRLRFPDQSHGEGTDLLGLHLTGSAADQLRALPQPRDHELFPHEVLIKEEREVGRRMHAVETLKARVDPAAVDRVLAQLPLGTGRCVSPDVGGLVDAVRIPVDGSECDVLEETVLVGPERLPGIVTRPLAGTDPGAVLLLSGASDPRSCGGLWPDLARALAAAHGKAVLRVDRSGCGDAGESFAVRDPAPQTEDAIQSVRDSILWLVERHGAPVTGVGLCAGAWLLQEVVRGRRNTVPHLERVVCINHAEWRRSRILARRIIDRIFYTQETSTRYAAGVVDRGTDRAAVKRKVKSALAQMPEPVRRWLGRTRWLPLPDDPLTVLTARAQVHLVYGDHDWNIYRATLADRAVARLSQRGRDITVEHRPELDHALVCHSARRVAVGLLLQNLAATGASAGRPLMGPPGRGTGSQEARTYRP